MGLVKQENLNRLLSTLISTHLDVFPSTANTYPRVIEQGVLLFDSAQWMLVLRPAAPDSSYIKIETVTAPNNPFAFANCSEQPAKLPVYRISGDESRSSIFKDGIVEVSPQTLHVFDDCSKIVDVSACRTSSAIFLYSLARPAEIRREYSLATSRPLFSSIGDPGLSTVKILLQWLSELGAMEPDDYVLKRISSLSNHPFHIVRWAAIQAMAAIDFNIATPYIIAAQFDKHPNIASVAKRIVEREGL